MVWASGLIKRNSSTGVLPIKRLASSMSETPGNSTISRSSERPEAKPACSVWISGSETPKTLMRRSITSLRLSIAPAPLCASKKYQPKRPNTTKRMREIQRCLAEVIENDYTDKSRRHNYSCVGGTSASGSDSAGGSGTDSSIITSGVEVAVSSIITSGVEVACPESACGEPVEPVEGAVSSAGALASSEPLEEVSEDEEPEERAAASSSPVTQISVPSDFLTQSLSV